MFFRGGALGAERSGKGICRSEKFETRVDVFGGPREKRGAGHLRMKKFQAVLPGRLWLAVKVDGAVELTLALDFVGDGGRGLTVSQRKVVEPLSFEGCRRRAGETLRRKKKVEAVS